MPRRQFPDWRSFLALPPLIQKQRHLCRCKQSIKLAEILPHHTGKISISCSETGLLYALCFVAQTRWTISGTFEFKQPWSMLSDWSELGSSHILWQTQLCFARSAAQRDPHHWNAALFHFGCLRMHNNISPQPWLRNETHFWKSTIRTIIISSRATSICPHHRTAGGLWDYSMLLAHPRSN